MLPLGAALELRINPFSEPNIANNLRLCTSADMQHYKLAPYAFITSRLFTFLRKLNFRVTSCPQTRFGALIPTDINSEGDSVHNHMPASGAILIERRGIVLYFNRK